MSQTHQTQGKDTVDMKTMFKQSGFTLVELMIALAIAAILLTIGVPSFENQMRNSRLTAAANDFVASVQLARSAAIKHRRNARIVSANGTNWGNGWTVWVDKNSNNAQEGDEVLRVFDPVDASGKITFSAAAQGSFIFSGTGMVDNMGSLTLCDTRTGETGRIITISAAGRVNTSPFACP